MPRYELIATVIRRNGPHKALIRDVKVRRAYYFAVRADLAERGAVARFSYGRK